MKNMTSHAIILLSILLSIQAFSQTTTVKYLSGTGNDNTVQWDFFCTKGQNSGKWTKIEVPSCWEQKGFGAYNYGLDKLEDRVNEEGKYKLKFMAERSWKGKNVEIVFDGVMTDCEVKVNGKLAGEVHQGAFYQFSYNISPLLKYGKTNQLEVHVKKHSDNESVNQAERFADYWVFGGIFRPVYLEIKPEEHIKRVAVDARADGAFRSEVLVSKPTKGGKLSVKIIDQSGEEKAEFSASVKGQKVMLSGKFPSPKLWTPEFPNLYKAQFQLLDKNGKTIHLYEEKIGFRTVEVRAQDGIYVNGVRIKFKGVNRHTFHPDHGRTSSKALSIKDVNIIKDMNMNAVRMAHYPPEKHFLDACDSLGLFVLDELAGWQACYDSIVGRKLLKEMIDRDVNHPSIVLWDNGNEGGWNTAYDQDFGQLDIQKREVLHPWAVFEKMNTAHYIKYNYLARDNFVQRKIFFPTEFLHGLYDGGHGAGLADYWKYMWADPLCAGGFLWAYADECTMRTDTKKLDGDGNHAPDGILGPYLEKEGSYYAIKEIWSPVHFEKRYITPEFNGIFNIENRYHYTKLSQCTFTYEWLQLPMPFASKTKNKVLAKGTAMADDLLPGEKGKLKVELCKNWQEADVLVLTIVDPHGRKINRLSWPVKTPLQVFTGLRQTPKQDEFKAEEQADRFVFSNATYKFEFSKKDGTLLSVSNRNGLVPLSGGTIMDSKLISFESVKHYEENAKHIIETRCKDNQLVSKWILQPNGQLDLEIAYEKPKDMPQFAGISFNYPEAQVSKVKYMGEGPYRVWKNRLAGTNFGVWEKTKNNTITGHAGFEYPEFKGYHSNLYWAKFEDAKSSGFRVFCKSEDIFMRLFSPDKPEKPKGTDINHPEGDISFLHGIPAIGTKFKKPTLLGPQSQGYSFMKRRIDKGMLSMALSFDFSGE